MKSALSLAVIVSVSVRTSPSPFMATSNNNQVPNGEEEVITNSSRHDESDHHPHQELLLSLPKGYGWGVEDLYYFQGFWCPDNRVEAVIALQRDFEAHDTDTIIATVPRSGTLWLKSMAFAIVNRTRYPYQGDLSHLNFTNIQSPRLLSTHLPYPSLPESIKNNNTNCRIVYLCRNPKDNFISLWHFLNKRSLAKRTIDATNDHTPAQLPLEEALDLFCNGVSMFGPFWDHVLGYWKASLERPETMLFLKYEDIKKHPKSHLKRLAEFLGHPFSVEEESEGVMEEILSLCSFEHLRNLDVNKYGQGTLSFGNKIFFRKAEVGDWKNYFTPAMAERLDCIIEEKLRGSGLVFQNSLD
ncbi:Sulfotransferase domain [Macleaya cordata]|uniref:Sulfotransferase n=1 Tax=Macleaya cordata TaxID=56857 RepID=A0A200QQE4_MACCD|nr:Sulfotransferase domain [Macleaya cordata]